MRNRRARLSSRARQDQRPAPRLRQVIPTTNRTRKRQRRARHIRKAVRSQGDISSKETGRGTVGDRPPVQPHRLGCAVGHILEVGRRSIGDRDTTSCRAERTVRRQRQCAGTDSRRSGIAVRCSQGLIARAGLDQLPVRSRDRA